MQNMQPWIYSRPWFILLCQSILKTRRITNFHGSTHFAISLRPPKGGENELLFWKRWTMKGGPHHLKLLKYCKQEFMLCLKLSSNCITYIFWNIFIPRSAKKNATQKLFALSIILSLTFRPLLCFKKTTLSHYKIIAIAIEWGLTSPNSVFNCFGTCVICPENICWP